MTIFLVFFCWVTGALVMARLALQRWQDWVDEAADCRPEDLDALRTSTEHEEQAFLRGELLRAEFVRRKRLDLKRKWKATSRISANAERMLRWARISRVNSDVRIAEQAGKAVARARQIRVHCLRAFAKLTVQYLFPTLRLKGHRS